MNARLGCCKMNVTDCERVASVTTDKNGYFKCPKCQGTCEQTDQKAWDCIRCCRGWEVVEADNLEDAMKELTQGD